MLKTKSATPSREGGNAALAEVVEEIISAVARDGDDAVRAYSSRLDGWEPESLLAANELQPVSVVRAAW